MIGASLRLLRELGRGGMGTVWVAEHRTLGTQVAVKFLAQELAADPVALARFGHEAATAARLKSQHVVQTYDHGLTSDGMPYIVMELLEGHDLGAHLERYGALEVPETVRMSTHVAKALTKAHEAGLVHRDIKPENIFMTYPDGEMVYKVLDFGVAKLVGAGKSPGVTSAGALVGTPYYMSPEQLLDTKHVDHRSDLWSLAVVVYQALTGRRPFEGDTIGGLCLAIDRGVFRLPTTMKQNLPPALDAWFVRALSRDPASRFQSAREMAVELSNAVREAGSGGWQAGLSSTPPPIPSGPTIVIAATPPAAGTMTGSSVTKHGAALRPRRWPLVAAAVVGLFGVAGAAVFVFAPGHHAATRRPAASGVAMAQVPVDAPAVAPSAPEVTPAPGPPPSASTIPAPPQASRGPPPAGGHLPKPKDKPPPQPGGSDIGF